eukprot:scaffold119805_cov20-Prasinocladus_malaysianus.AAC.1
MSLAQHDNTPSSRFESRIHSFHLQIFDELADELCRHLNKSMLRCLARSMQSASVALDQPVLILDIAHNK